MFQQTLAKIIPLLENGILVNTSAACEEPRRNIVLWYSDWPSDANQILKIW